MSGKNRQSLTYQALLELGGRASTAQIAEKTGLGTNGVAQTLGAMHSRIDYLGSRGANTEWQIHTPQ